MTKHFLSMPYYLAFILLFLKECTTNAFQIDSDYSYCNSLIIKSQISQQELNSTTGMVLQFTQSKNIQDPALFNTTLAWTDFVPYVTYDVSRLLPATQIGNTYYYTNISMTSAMNSSWVGSGSTQEYHTIMWLYVQPPNTTDPNLRTSYGGLGNPFVPTSTVNPFCYSFYNANGTRTDYNPNLIPSSNGDSSSGGSDGLSTGEKVGVAIGCIITVLLLLGIVVSIGYCCSASIRALIRRKCLRGKKHQRDDLQPQQDEESANESQQDVIYQSEGKGKGKNKDKKKVGSYADDKKNVASSLQDLDQTQASTSFGGIDINALSALIAARQADEITPVPQPIASEEEAPPPSYTEANATRGKDNDNL